MLTSNGFQKSINRKQTSILFFALNVFVVSCFGYFTNGFEVDVLPRLIRLFLCLIIAALLGGHYFDYKYAKKYVIFIAIVATVLIVFQKVYHDVTGEFIYFISKGNIYSASIYNSAYFQNVETLSTYRPMSIFLEPSHYCQYVLFALAIVLFNSKLSAKDFLIAVLISVGVFISTSSTGIILCLAIWAVYLFKLIKKGALKSINPKILSIIFLVALVGIFILARFGENLIYAIERLYNPDTSSTTAAWDSRLGTFSIFGEYQHLSDMLFGRGFGVIDENKWYASIPYYYSGTGMLGLLAIITLFVSLWIRANKLQRILIVVFFVLCFTTEVLTNYWLIFVLPLIMTATEEKEIENQ